MYIDTDTGKDSLKTYFVVKDGIGIDSLIVEVRSFDIPYTYNLGDLFAALPLDIATAP